MKTLVSSYTFTAASKTVQAAAFLAFENILAIFNVTRGVMIYFPGSTATKGTFAGTTLTLTYDTTAHADADHLEIWYWDASAAQPVSGTFWQATQPVSGTFWQATQPVSGPLTDTQLRAAAVPVSGTFWQATQPVSAAALPLPTGAATSANQGTVISGLASIDGHVDGLEASASSIDGKITACNTGAVVLAAGAATIGKLAANSGVIIGDVNIAAAQTIAVTNAGTFAVQAVCTNAGTFAVQATTCGTITPGTGATSLGKAEDAASASGDVGVMALAVQLATPADSAGTDGDYSPLQMSAGRLWCSSKIDTALPAGTNAIGKLAANAGVTIGAVELAAAQTLGTVTTVSTVTNLSQLGGVAISMGTGTRGTGVQRVTICTDDVVPASQSGTWNIGTVTTVTTVTAVTAITNALPAGTNTLGQVGLVPVTSGGSSLYSALSTAAVLSAVVKASAGQVYSLEIFNTTGTVAYVRLYNQTGAPASTDGANILWRGAVPANTSGAGFVVTWPEGKAFGTGIGIRASYAIADNDTTALAAGVLVNVGYK